HFRTFIYQYSLNQQYLHSFPTRRSSDLGIDTHVIKTGLGQLGISRLVSKGEIIQGEVVQTAGDAGAVGGLAAAAGTDVEAERLQDRKSTRLNSSHVKISYAVFCLKKKKL